MALQLWLVEHRCLNRTLVRIYDFERFALKPQFTLPVIQWYDKKEVGHGSGWK